jgi:voltage-gated potassium channel
VTDSPSPGAEAVRLPRPPVRPAAALVRRLVLAIGLVLLVAVAVYVDQDGYVDDTGQPITFLSAVYYASVTVTTTGYGDITPVTPRARLVTTVLVTPARVLFLILLVGTTMELLTERWREIARLHRWRSKVEDHYVVCGYGTKGRSAVATLRGHGIAPDRLVIVDGDATAVEEATNAGLAAVHGDATRTAVLVQAQVDRAAGVVVAVNRDDAAVLITLTARELNRSATIASAVREDENAHLLRESGADSVITSSEASGRLLGVAIREPLAAEVLEDLLTVGQGLDVVEHTVSGDEAGAPPPPRPGEVVIAVVRDGRRLRFDDPEAQRLQAGDRVVAVCAHGEAR